MSSTKRLARIAGLLYLVVAIFGAFAFAYVLGKVYVPGDATTTATNVLANSGLVRIGVAADLIQATVFVFVGMTLYLLLSHVNKSAAGAMVILVAIASAIMCLNDVFQIASLLIATDPSYVTAFGAAGANSLVLLMLDMQHYGFIIAQIFFGLWLVPLGYLAYKSEMFPRALGIVLIVGGSAYLVDVFATLLIPDFGKTIHPFLIIPFTVAEVWMLGYLLIKGVRTPANTTTPASSEKTPPALAADLP